MYPNGMRSNKLAADVASFPNAEAGCLTVGVTDSHKALEALNILL